ncbi:hypothetical protein EMPS_07228 [Entomortierella parvispora]|uniref:Uncharacterized protein n=1 Tax=Entomortierella parvispora TaxID=205924 RepID=A0A9P3HE45_9FUNG|nr:hypothetical protein EMPS_07228 [Entomortierella parvispora]
MRFGADSAAAALCRGCPRCHRWTLPAVHPSSPCRLTAPSWSVLPPLWPASSHFPRGLGARGGFSSPIHSPLVSRGNGAREATRHQLSH